MVTRGEIEEAFAKHDYPLTTEVVVEGGLEITAVIESSPEPPFKVVLRTARPDPDELTPAQRFEAIRDFAAMCKDEARASPFFDRFEYIVVLSKAGLA